MLVETLALIWRCQVDIQGGRDAPQLYPLKLSHLKPRAMQDDLVMLESLDPPLIAHCLQYRHTQDHIYTWVGADHSVLVSVNPFKILSIYGARAIAEFAAPAPNRSVPPHTFALAAKAYSAMRETRASQSILISGESGAGKTEATKQCLSFLAEVRSNAFSCRCTP